MISAEAPEFVFLFDEAEMKAGFVVIRRIVCGAVWFIKIKRHESQCP